MMVVCRSFLRLLTSSDYETKHFSPMIQIISQYIFCALVLTAKHTHTIQLYAFLLLPLAIMLSILAHCWI